MKMKTRHTGRWSRANLSPSSVPIDIQSSLATAWEAGGRILDHIRLLVVAREDLHTSFYLL